MQLPKKYNLLNFDPDKKFCVNCYKNSLLFWEVRKYVGCRDQERKMQEALDGQEK